MNTSTQPILRILEPASRLPHGNPLLRLGFRPFYLGAAAFAAVAIPVWVMVFLGYMPWSLPIEPLLWHAHEMLFGFASAVIIGFLMTAGKAWTQLQTPRGAGLGALALLWLAARIAALTGPYPLYFALDVSLLPIVAVILVRLLLKAGNRRNLPLALLLMALSGTNLAFHLSATGALNVPPLQPLHAALALIIMIECVMAGRVIPGFTMSASPGFKVAPMALLETATLTTTAVALAAWVLQGPAWLATPALWIAAALHLGRQWRWHPWITLNKPVLWVLHAAYVWIPVGFALLGLSQLQGVTASAGVHALTIGATGGLIIGMITRTARGHTGRTLNVSKTEVLAYALVALAALLRVFLPLLGSHLYTFALVAAAGAWTLAFALYLAVYGPWLMQVRLDGRDG